MTKYAVAFAYLDFDARGKPFMRPKIITTYAPNGKLAAACARARLPHSRYQSPLLGVDQM